MKNNKIYKTKTFYYPINKGENDFFKKLIY